MRYLPMRVVQAVRGENQINTTNQSARRNQRGNNIRPIQRP